MAPFETPPFIKVDPENANEQLPERLPSNFRYRLVAVRPAEHRGPGQDRDYRGSQPSLEGATNRIPSYEKEP